MRRIVAALVIAVAPVVFFATPAQADDTATCKEHVKLEASRIAELTADVSLDSDLAKRLLDSATANDSSADSKDQQAAKLKAAADATTDPKKKKAYLELAKLLTDEAKTDRLFSKELKHSASIVLKAKDQAQAALDAHNAIIAVLRERCPTTT